MKHSKKASFKAMLKDQRGELGVKQIAATVAIIVIIGAIVLLIRNEFLENWIREIWTMFTDAIKDMMT